MLKKIVLGSLGLLVVGIAVILLLASRKPDYFEVKRSVVVQATPEKIYPLLIDFKQFGFWSPWEHLDPAMQRTFGGAAAGVSAVYAWKGNDQVGEGRMEITEIQPNQSVTVKLDFITPFESHNTTVYTLQSDGRSTTVAWSMTGPSPLITKIMTVFFSMDSMVGPDFERGLRQLKAVAEKL
jgi:hypothetical protein